MRTLLCLLALSLTSCASVESRVRKVPGFSFKSWSHSDRYGVFTDTISMSGAKWVLNADGSATLTVGRYEGSAAWAGSVGPHDVIEELTVTFPPSSPQAQALASKSSP